LKTNEHLARLEIGLKELTKENRRLTSKVCLLLGDKLAALPKLKFRLPLSTWEELRLANEECKRSKEEAEKLVFLLLYFYQVNLFSLPALLQQTYLISIGDGKSSNEIATSVLNKLLEKELRDGLVNSVPKPSAKDAHKPLKKSFSKGYGSLYAITDRKYMK